MNWVAPIKDEETLNAFKNELKKTDMKYYIMFEIGVNTGMQLQDILKLTIKDIKNKNQLTAEIGTKKVKSTFVFDDEFKKVLKDFCSHKPDDAPIVAGQKNKPLAREQAYRVFRSVGKKVGLASIGAQTMRKTFARNYYKETGDIYYLQNMFNHASPSITYRFIGEKPNIEIVLDKMTPQENERSRYLLYLNDNGKKRLNKIIDSLNDIKKNFDNPTNNDAYYGRVDCLLNELDNLMDNFENK